jgi:hypothetical protein
VVGTPGYQQKFENRVSHSGSIVAAEVDLIHLRLTGTEQEKDSVLPLLLDGSPEESLPPLLRGRVHADFRERQAYFMSLMDVVISMYDSALERRAALNLRQELREALGIRGISNA